MLNTLLVVFMSYILKALFQQSEMISFLNSDGGVMWSGVSFYYEVENVTFCFFGQDFQHRSVSQLNGWGTFTVRFEIEILLGHSLFCMLFQLSTMHYSAIQHFAVDSQVDLIRDRSQYVVSSCGIPFSKGFLQ